MANKLRAQIDEQKSKIEELNLKIQSVGDALENEKKQSQNLLQAKELEWQEKDKTKTEQHNTEIKTLGGDLEVLKNNLKEKDAQLDRKELKKLAVAFNDQEEIHKGDQKKWLIALIFVATMLIIYAIWSIFLTSNKPWIDRIGYYAIDIILISAAWFCSSQFSEATRLRYDYGNRKTLAQSFNNILNNLSEDEGIRTKFIEKTTDVLCAPVGSNTKEPILTRKVLKDVAEIIGTVANK